jgi:copper oxidase (laccase) domain-containing protein
VPALLRALVERGARPERLHAAVLPSIGPCCFEVGDEVAERFPSAHLRPVPGSKPHLDLPAALLEQLALAGVAFERIRTWDLCTRCRADLFFSYRRDGRASGRMLAAIVRES